MAGAAALHGSDPVTGDEQRVSRLVRDEFALPNRVIVPDHKLYLASVGSLEEAHYLCAFLNSRSVRVWLGGFRSRETCLYVPAPIHHNKIQDDEKKICSSASSVESLITLEY